MKGQQPLDAFSEGMSPDAPFALSSPRERGIEGAGGSSGELPSEGAALPAAMETIADMTAMRLLKWLEDHSLELVDSWMKDGMDAYGEVFKTLDPQKVREMLYAFLLRVLTGLGEVAQVPTLQLMAETPDMKRVFYEGASHIVAAIENQSVHTVGHSRRVAMLAGRMAAALGLPDADTADIEYAAAIHNIGLINDAQRLYLQPRQLRGEELKRARHHAVIGAEILRPIEFLSNIVPMVLYHHTWYDGSGVPGGLQGEEIPLGARIIHLCDAFIAMISPRPHRPAKTVDEALEEIDKLAGKQFDPKLLPIIHTLAQGVMPHDANCCR